MFGFLISRGFLCLVGASPFQNEARPSPVCGIESSTLDLPRSPFMVAPQDPRSKAKQCPGLHLTQTLPQVLFPNRLARLRVK